jgi:transcriptional regulator with XRE-family HTH domain
MEALKEYMRLLEIDQVELAKRIGVGPDQLNHWIKKRRTPSVENLKNISAKTGIGLERLARDL